MAMDPLEKCIVMMLCSSEDIFFAHVISQLKRHPSSTIPTAGVYVVDGYMHLDYNLEWFAKLKLKEQIGVMRHEIMHLILEHIIRGKNYDKRKFTIAADVAVNHFIPTLPAGCLRAEQFKVPDGKAAEWYYNHIKLPKAKCVCANCGATIDPKTGKGCKCKGGHPVPSQDIKPLDDHSVWDKSTGGQYSKEIIKQAVRRAVENTERGRGSLPGNLAGIIKKLLAPPQIPWNRLLRQYLCNQIKAGKKSSWKRENRRYGDLVQGRTSDWTFRIAIGVDTSGSISQKDLRLFTAEISGIQKAHKTDITVLECDDGIQNVWKLTKYKQLDKEVKFKGGGGTDFRHVFRYIRDHHVNIMVLVFLTDMYGVFPEEKPPFETIWVSCSDETKAPWGKVVQVKPIIDDNPGDYDESNDDSN